MNRIITIGRQFGSGGRELGRRLAEQLEIPYYDREILKEIADRTLIPETYVRQVIEKRKIPVFSSQRARSIQMAMSPEVEESCAIFQEQKKIILELAQKSDCMIVGRCADYILKDQNPFRIFVYADMESRMARCRKYASNREHYSDKELEKYILEIDKKRASYYEFHTGQKWGAMLNYDLCVNTTGKTIEEILAELKLS